MLSTPFVTFLFFTAVEAPTGVEMVVIGVTAAATTAKMSMTT